jgi:hypothetical protein
MMAALLVAGIGFLLAGLLAIGFGIPVKEFSFGNTLIITGAIAACGGVMMLGLGLVVRELQVIARRLGPYQQAESRAEARLQAVAAAPRNPAAGDGLLFGGGQPAAEHAGDAGPGEPSSAPSPPPWLDEASSRLREDAPEAAEAVPAAKPRRNLLFSSSSRKERERAEVRTGDQSAADLRPPAAAAPPPEPREAPPATFDDAWPKPERGRGSDVPPQRRSGRAPSSFTEANAAAAVADRAPPLPRQDDPPQVTVLKSGVVDGMAYSLYSDGSIEAQMPEGMMRFASIDELRSHLDQRP